MNAERSELWREGDMGRLYGICTNMDIEVRIFIGNFRKSCFGKALSFSIVKNLRSARSRGLTVGVLRPLRASLVPALQEEAGTKADLGEERKRRALPTTLSFREQQLFLFERSYLPRQLVEGIFAQSELQVRRFG